MAVWDIMPIALKFQYTWIINTIINVVFFVIVIMVKGVIKRSALKRMSKKGKCGFEL